MNYIGIKMVVVLSVSSICFSRHYRTSNEGERERKGEEVKGVTSKN